MRRCLITATSNKEIFLNDFLVILKHREEMFPRYYLHSEFLSKLNSSTTQQCATRGLFLQSTMSIGSEHVVGAPNSPLLTH